MKIVSVVVECSMWLYTVGRISILCGDNVISIRSIVNYIFGSGVFVNDIIVLNDLFE